MSFDVGISGHAERGSISAAYRLPTGCGRPSDLGRFSATSLSQSQTSWTDHQCQYVALESKTPNHAFRPGKSPDGEKNAPCSTNLNVRRGNRIRRRPAWFDVEDHETEGCNSIQRQVAGQRWVGTPSIGQTASTMQKDFEVPVPVNSNLKKEGACPIPPPSPACCEAASTLMSFSQLTSSSNTEHPLCYCQSEEFGPKVLQNPNEQVPLIAGDESNVVCLVRLIEPPSGSTPKRPPCLLEPQPLSPSIAG